jgi:hypothetical protein
LAALGVELKPSPEVTVSKDMKDQQAQEAAAD